MSRARLGQWGGSDSLQGDVLQNIRCAQVFQAHVLYFEFETDACQGYFLFQYDGNVSRASHSEI